MKYTLMKHSVNFKELLEMKYIAITALFIAFIPGFIVTVPGRLGMVDIGQTPSVAVQMTQVVVHALLFHVAMFLAASQLK